MARVRKSVKVNSGYFHREHRSKKNQKPDAGGRFLAMSARRRLEKRKAEELAREEGCGII